MSQPMSTQIPPMAAHTNPYEHEEDPAQAMSVYARIMHEHTKAQLSTATSSARRRSQGSDVASNSTSSAGATPT